MPKFKPTLFPIASGLVRSGEPGWALVAGVFEFVLAADQSSKGNQVWSCGNPKCNSTLRLRYGTIPKVCSMCGGEIDWVGIKTRIIKICPTCNRTGLSTEVYCAIHVPAIRLVDKEIPL